MSLGHSAKVSPLNLGTYGIVKQGRLGQTCANISIWAFKEGFCAHVISTKKSYELVDKFTLNNIFRCL